jgi:hypothetical protein
METATRSQHQHHLTVDEMRTRPGTASGAGPTTSPAGSHHRQRDNGGEQECASEPREGL